MRQRRLSNEREPVQPRQEVPKPRIHVHVQRNNNFSSSEMETESFLRCLAANKSRVALVTMVAAATIFGLSNMRSLKNYQQRGRMLLTRDLRDSLCYENMIINSNFEEGGEGSVSGWYATDSMSTFGPVPSDMGGNALYVAYRKSTTEGVRTSLSESALYPNNCLTGDGFYLHVQAKVKMLYQDTGEGVWTCLDPSQPYIDGNWAKYNCPMFTITTHRTDEPVETRFEIHDFNMQWNPNGEWNTVDFVYQVPDVQTGNTIDDIRLEIFGGPSNAALYVDDVSIARIDPESLTGTENILTPAAPTCFEKMDTNSDGPYTAPLGWESFGRWFGSTNIDPVPDETSPSGYSMIAYERDMPEYQGVGYYLDPDCISYNEPSLHIEIDVMLYDEATGGGVINCDATTDITILNCPFVQFDLRRHHWENAIPYRYFDHVMIGNWDPYGWNRISLVVQLFENTDEVDRTRWAVGLMNVLGGPKGSVLKIGHSSITRVNRADFPANIPVLFYNGKQLLPEWCYDNFIKNHQFEDALNEWENTDSGNTFEIVPNDENGSNALYFAYRSSWKHGALQRVNEATGCLVQNPDNSPFYLRIKARVKMLIQGTNRGAPGCVDTQIRARGNFARYNCPHFKVSTHRAKATRNIVTEAHDVNLEWVQSRWNDVDIIYEFPSSQMGSNIDDFTIQILGGPLNAAVFVDDLTVARVEEADLPEDNPIWDPHVEQKCTENILQNGEGEYQTPWGWDSFGRFFGHMKIDVVLDESAETGYSMVTYDRTLPEYQGIGQFLRNNCFRGNDYYIHLTAIVQLYDQNTGVGVSTCGTETVDSMLNCPFIQLDIRREGERTGLPYRFFDRPMIENWDPYGWNKINVVLAIAPSSGGRRLNDERINLVLFNFLGGPKDSVLKIDNVVGQRIDDYAELPSGVPILGLEGDPLMGAIKVCSCLGDPHYVSYGHQAFDNHEVGWLTLYEQGNLKIEAHHTHLVNGVSIATAIRINYLHEERPLYYEFTDGATPLVDNTLSFPDPPVKVSIAGVKLRGVWAYGASIVTSDTKSCTGACCDDDDEQVRTAPTEVETILCDTAMPRKDAEAMCYATRDTDQFEACILDVRIMSCVEGGEEDMQTLIGAAVDSSQVQRSAMVAAEEEVHFALTGEGTAPDYGVVGDPLIMGLSNQVFKFDGRNDAWYANLASESLQWNMKFHQFDGCPDHEDLFVTELGVGFYQHNYLSSLFRNHKPRIMLHSVAVRVIDENEFFPGCPNNDEVCLGDGSLEIVVDGERITSPGDYYSSANGGVRIVAYNVDGACSRKWFDFVETEETNLFGRPARFLSSNKPPIDYLLEDWETMINPIACNEWAQDRVQYDDLFLQRGRWSTIHIETPLVTLHVEYRQNIASGNCLSHNIDAWMAEVSPELRSQTWKGILGETRRPMYHKNGEQIIGDRSLLLSGKEDSDYEVLGPFGSEFAAQNYGSWSWLGRG